MAFMDIRCASRAHDSVNVLEGSTLVTAYNESSTTPAPVVSVPAGGGSLAVTNSAETTPRDVRRHAAAERRSPGLNGATSSAKCHRRSDGYVLGYSAIYRPYSMQFLRSHCYYYHYC